MRCINGTSRKLHSWTLHAWTGLSAKGIYYNQLFAWFFYFSSPADSRSTATKNWHDFPCHGREKPAKSDADGVKQKETKIQMQPTSLFQIQRQAIEPNGMAQSKR